MPNATRTKTHRPATPKMRRTANPTRAGASPRSATPRRPARPKRSVGAGSVRVSHGQRRIAIAMAVANLLVGGTAGFLWYDDRQAYARESAGQRCLARSTAATQAIFSYDYRTFDASVANARPFLTGAFAREYEETTRGLKSAAEQQQAVVRAEVSAAGVSQVRADGVEVLLYVNQYRRNVAVTGEKVDQNRVILTMVPGEDCRVVRATAI